MNKQECLEKALEICTGSREVAYGKPENNFDNISALWSAYLQKKWNTSNGISSTDVAAMMVLMKVARLIHNPSHADSWIDIWGYGANGAEVSEAE